MPKLIPHLKDLHSIGEFTVPATFVEMYVNLHHESGQGGAPWRTAQQHWERVVERVLLTDAVAPDADGDVAIDQAVTAAVTLLHDLAEKGSCPMCPPTPPAGRQHVHRKHV